MAIGFATELAGKIAVFDEKGHPLRFPSVDASDGIVGYSASTVSVRNAGYLETYDIDGRLISQQPAEPSNVLRVLESAADAADPPEGQAAIWVSDGTGTGDDGDVIIKTTAGGVTSTKTLVDYTDPAAAITATADGLTTGLIAAGVEFVTVTSASANNIATLPSATAALVGTVIKGWVGANGCELRTPAASTATINGVDSDGTNEAAIPATTLFELTCVAEGTWVLRAWSELGVVITAIVPDAA